jgi:hypothetical protein
MIVVSPPELEISAPVGHGYEKKKRRRKNKKDKKVK